MQEKKALSSRGRGRLVGFLQLWRQYQISHEVRRGAQRASRVVLGTSGLRACGEGECVLALESREGTRASRRVDLQALVRLNRAVTRIQTLRLD